MFDVYTNRYRDWLHTQLIGHNIIGRFNDIDSAINACIRYSLSGYGIGTVYVIDENGNIVTYRRNYC